jgi:hypothetical protein
LTRVSQRKGNRPPLTLLQVLTLVGLVAGLLIVLDFNQRLAVAQRLVDARNQAATEVALLEQEQFMLQTQVAYATTDAAVIQWAHESGKLVQPGEVLVVPVVPTPTATPPPLPATPPPPPPAWTLWWNLFFDTQP